MVGKLFLTFLEIGAFTFGGGYAMVPLIQREVCGKQRWLTDEEFLNCLALAQSAPGPLAINTAAYIGYRLRGIAGLLAAVLGAALPSFVIILVVASFFDRFAELPPVQAAFRGMRPAIFMLMAYAALSLGRKTLHNKFSLVLAAVALVLLLLGLPTFAVLLLAGIVGFLRGGMRDASSS